MGFGDAHGLQAGRSSRAPQIPPHLTFCPPGCVMVSGTTACRESSAPPSLVPSSCDDLLQTAGDGRPSPRTSGASQAHFSQASLPPG